MWNSASPPPCFLVPFVPPSPLLSPLLLLSLLFFPVLWFFRPSLPETLKGSLVIDDVDLGYSFCVLFVM